MIIQFKAHPFKYVTKPIEIALPASLEKVADACAPHAETLEITINGEGIPPARWADTFPDSDDLVIVYAVPGDERVARIGTAAALIAGSFFFPVLIPAAVGATAYAIGAEFIKVPKVKSSSNNSDPLVFSITGASNQVDPFGVIPKVYGQIRVFPKFPGKHPLQYTEIVGQDQFLRCLFLVAKGPVTISDIKLGDNALGNFTNVETEILEGKAGDPVITIYTRDVVEDIFNLALTNAGGYQTRTTGLNCDRISVDWFFPQGISFIQKDGDRKGRTVTIEIDYKLVGAGSWITRGLFSVHNNSSVSIRKNESWDVATGQYDVRIRRTTPDETDRQFGITFWTVLRTIRNETPVLEPDVAMIALRIKATDQLNGLIDNLNCLVQAEVDTYNGASWTVPTVTKNPAWAVADILTGNGHVRPLPQARLNGASFKAFADYCTTEGFEFNHVFDTDGTVFDSANLAAAVGRGHLDNVDGEYIIVVDKAQAAVKQHFTPINSWAIQGAINYPDLPHGLRIGFRNAALDYQEDERVVFDDGFNEGNATKYDFLEFAGITDSDQIWKIGRYLLAHRKLRFEEWNFNADLEHLVVTRGDLAVLAHDAVLVGLGWGRIVTVNGNPATSIVIDTFVTMTAGPTYGVQIRTDDNVSIDKQINNTANTTKTLTFSSSVSGTQPGVGDLLLFGEFGQVSQRVIVKSVQPTQESGSLAATLTVMYEAPAVYTADTGTIPAHTPIISIGGLPGNAIPPTPIITGIRSDESVLRINDDGSFQVQMVVSLSISGNFTPASVFFQLQTRIFNNDVNAGSPWETGPLVDGGNGEIRVQDVEVLLTYEVRARSLNRANASLFSPWTTPQTHTVVGDTLAPDPPSNVALTPGNSSISLFWINPLDGLGGTLIDFDVTEIFRHIANDSSLAGFVSEETGRIFIDSPLVNGTEYFYWLRSRDLAGNVGAFHRTQFDGQSATPLASLADLTPPATPTGLQLAPGGSVSADGTFNGRIVVSWNGNTEPDLHAYHLEWRKLFDHLTLRVIRADVQTTVLEFLEPNLTYEARIRAVDTSGNTSAFSAFVQASVTDPGAASIPTGFVIVAFPLAIGLSWNLNPEKDVIGYELQRADNLSFTVNVVTLSRTLSLSYIDRLGPGITRYYRLRAVRRSGSLSAFTGIVSATTVGIDTTELELAAVEAANLADGAVTESKILNAAVTQLKVASDAIGPNELANLAVIAGKIATNAITAQNVVDQSLSGDKLTLGAVDFAQLAENAVINNRIQDGAITNLKIAANQIDSGHLQALSVIAGKLAVDSVTSQNIVTQSIAGTDLALGAVDTAQLAEAAIIANRLANNAVTEGAILNNSISAGKVQANAIGATAIQAAAIAAVHLQANAVTAGAIAAGAIIAGKIFAGAVGANELAANSVVAGKIAAGAIVAGNLAAGSVTTTELAASSVTAAKIVGNVIGSQHLVTSTAVITTAAQITAALIDSVHIVDAAIKTAKIDDLQVNTIKIANNAISNKAEGSATYGPIQDSGWQQALSVGFTTSGGSVLVQAYLNLGSGTTSLGPFRVRLLRGATVLAQLVPATGQNPVLADLDSPPPSTFNYRIEVQDDSATALLHYHVKMLILETLK